MGGDEEGAVGEEEEGAVGEEVVVAAVAAAAAPEEARGEVVGGIRGSEGSATEGRGQRPMAGSRGGPWAEW